MFDVFYKGPKPGIFAFEQPADTIEQADLLCRTEYFWFIDGHNDYKNFNFYWKPISYEADHTHVWPSQWQQNGGTLLIPKGTKEHKWHWRDANTDGLVKRVTNTDIFYMDFMNAESQDQFETLKKKYPNIKSTRYVSDHLNVFKRIINLATTEYVWIISSICNYVNFDFTWHPAQWQEEMIHCFSSSNQKRGDTFYIHVESFRKQMYDLELLDWFNVINYIEDLNVPRFDWPSHYYQTDNLINEIKDYEFKTPYAIFTNQKDCYPFFNPCLWSEKDRIVEAFTGSNSICAAPRDIKTHLDTQIYDYPYISDNKKRFFFAEDPLDIVYISNGEPNEKLYYDQLQLSTHENGYPGRMHWVKGINGRTAAYKEAARQSNTPWFFAVFAKLRIYPNFDFNWKPDYFQQPKHYIFHAKNPVNGLEYGHMAMIAYNKKLVLEAENIGLDFTLSAEHEVVPVLCGVAEYNQDEWMTWRTAFREVIKLKHFGKISPSVENEFRLKKWLTVGLGAYGQWSTMGAADAVQYYDEVNGQYDQLMLSYEWDWLKQYFNKKY